jgi:phosphatidylglycerophosphate synthase
MRLLGDLPRAPASIPWRPLHEAGSDLALGLLPLLVMTAATYWMLDLPGVYPLGAVALYAVQAVLILRAFPRAPRPPLQDWAGLGPPSRVTLARAALVFPVAALVLVPGVGGTAGAWWIIALSTVALVMDGFDGWVARRTASSTPFGARFDMELDAFLLMALSLLVWQDGRVGVWVLLIGGLRYLFVAAAIPLPALGGELPPSFRRKVVCVIQGIALLVALGPIIPGPLAVGVSAVALASLLYSFGVDALWLLRKKGGG